MLVALNAELDTGMAMKKILVLLVIVLAGCDPDNPDKYSAAYGKVLCEPKSKQAFTVRAGGVATTSIVERAKEKDHVCNGV